MNNEVKKKKTIFKIKKITKESKTPTDIDRLLDYIDKNYKDKSEEDE